MDTKDFIDTASNKLALFLSLFVSEIDFPLDCDLCIAFDMKLHICPPLRAALQKSSFFAFGLFEQVGCHLFPYLPVSFSYL